MLRGLLSLVAVLALGLATSPARADGLMFVQAGAFWMGRDDGAPEEAPLHRVFVAAFWIDRHKVTNAEVAEFLQARGAITADGERRYDWDDADARIRRAPGGHWLVQPGFEHHPAVEVSWFGARDYCAWRGRRLPTEAEWEKAGRGDDKRLYPWGTTPPTASHAVFGRGYNATEPTDGRPEGASPYGVHDMLGNLREWTATIATAYPYRADDGRDLLAYHHPGGVERGGGPPLQTVVRGAAHDDPAEALSVTARRAYDRRGASAGHHHVGFRCATSEDLGEVAPGGRR